MTTKCTSIMGRIFGHDWIVMSVQRNGDEATYRKPSYKALYSMYLYKGDDVCICQRCGAVTGA